MKRKFQFVLLLTVLAFSFSGCKSWDEAYEEAASATFTVDVLKGPSAVGLVKMMEPSIKPNPKLGDTVGYVIGQDPEALYEKLLSEEIDVAVIPTDMAARLYNEGGKYQLAAVTTGGFMYVLTDGVTIANWSDLKGKEVDIAEAGSVSDVVFRYLLSKNGIDPDKDLILAYAADPEELAQTAMDGNSAITVLAEPYVSMVLAANKKSEIALDVQKEWANINGKDTPLPQTCLIVNTALATQDSEEMGLLLDDYSDSVDWVKKKPADAAGLLDKHDVGMSAEIAEEAIPRSNLLFIGAEEARPAVDKYLQVLMEASPDAIGGKLPDAAFYYVE